MKRTIGRIVVAGLAALGLTLTLAPAAGAEDCSVQLADGSSGDGRVFTGEVKSNRNKKVKEVGKKLPEVTIRQGGDPVPFVAHEAAVVSGLKSEIGKVKKGDWVKICGKGMARPRWAYSIEVIPEPDVGAEEVD